MKNDPSRPMAERREATLPQWAQNELRGLRQKNEALEAMLTQIAGEKSQLEFGHPILHSRHGYLPDTLPIRFHLDDMGYIEAQLQAGMDGEIPVVRVYGSPSYHFLFSSKPVSSNGVDLTFVPRQYGTKAPKRDA